MTDGTGTAAGRTEPFSLGPAAGVIATLSAIAASITIGVAELSLGTNGPQFFENNSAPRGMRTGLVVAILVALAVPALVALVKIWRQRARGVEDLRSVSHLLSPLLVAWALPPLFGGDAPSQRPIGFLLLLAFTVLALQFLLRLSIESVPPAWRLPAATTGARAFVRRFAPATVLGVACTAYACFMTYFSIQEHHRFQTGGYDLGIYTSLIRNLIAGYFYRAPVLHPELNYLAHHAEFGAIYLIPIYALFPRAETLLVLQSITMGAAAIPLYLFARTQIPRGPSLLVAVSFLFFAPIHGANMYDFHWMPMTMPLWFTLLYGIATRRLAIIIPTVMLVLPMREETGLMLGAVGFLLLASGYWPILGVVFGVVGVSWFFLMRLVVIPMHGDAGFAGIYQNLVPPGGRGFGGLAQTVLSNPNFVWTTLAVEPKLKFLLHMLAPLAFLPVRRAPLVLLLVPGSIFTLLTTDYEPTVSITFQYVTHWVPWLFAATILVIRSYGLAPHGFARQRAAALAAFFGIFCHGVAYGAFFHAEPFRGGFHRVAFAMSESEKNRYDAFRTIVAEIPKDAAVAATDPQSPHLGDFVEACSLRITYCNAQYLLIARFSFAEEDRRNAKLAVTKESYGLVREIDGIYLFKRGYSSPGTARALRELGLPERNAAR